MKNLIYKTLLLGSFLLPLSVSAQEAETDKSIFFPNISEVNKDVTIGVIGAGFDEFKFGAFGINASYHGIYADLMFFPLTHSDNLGVDKWPDHYVYAFHAGYQIPIHKYKDGNIRIIPLFGYAKVSEGITDGSDYSIWKSAFPFSSYIHNHYTPINERSGFDYGGAIMLQNKDKKLLCHLCLGYTKYTMFIGIGMGF